MRPLSFIVFLLVLSSCIKDDIVDDYIEPKIRITSKVECLRIDSIFQCVAHYFNNIGKEEDVTIVWRSSNELVVAVDESTGLLKGIIDGASSIYADYISDGVQKTDSFIVHVNSTVTTCGSNSNKTGVVATTSSYPLSGSYTLTTQGEDLLLILGDNYSADNSLPGLYIYLSNNNLTIEGALELGPVAVFSGTHSYVIPNSGINDFEYILYFCKPFNVKVGDGIIPPN
jgi:hypothetical protein